MNSKRKKQLKTKIDELKNQITSTGVEIYLERRESSEEDNAIQHELLNKREMLEHQLEELQRSLHDDKEDGFEKIGSTYHLKTNADQTRRVTLVSSIDANPIDGKISVKSPLAVSLVDKAEGDAVDVQTPIGTVNYKIVKIEVS